MKQTMKSTRQKSRKKPVDVRAYTAEAPKEAREPLTRLRIVIRKAAPKATERISYGMPCYEYGGSGSAGRLLSFALFKKHISIFLSPSDSDSYAREWETYRVTKSSFHFPLDKPLPFELVSQTVKALVRMKHKDMEGEGR